MYYIIYLKCHSNHVGRYTFKGSFVTYSIDSSRISNGNINDQICIDQFNQRSIWLSHIEFGVVKVELKVG
jgi:hypothetical protein